MQDRLVGEVERQLIGHLHSTFTNSYARYHQHSSWLGRWKVERKNDLFLVPSPQAPHLKQNKQKARIPTCPTQEVFHARRPTEGGRSGLRWIDQNGGSEWDREWVLFPGQPSSAVPTVGFKELVVSKEATTRMIQNDVILNGESIIIESLEEAQRVHRWTSQKFRCSRVVMCDGWRIILCR